MPGKPLFRGEPEGLRSRWRVNRRAAIHDSSQDDSTTKKLQQPYLGPPSQISTWPLTYPLPARKAIAGTSPAPARS